MYPGDSRLITNWVKENGFDQAVLRGESNIDVNYDASGMWMADGQ